MNDTIISQNGVSSSQLSGHMHHGSIQSTPGKRREPQGCNSSGLSNHSHQALSNHHKKEGERIFQSRAVLLNLLQPPGNSMLRARRSSCTLPCQQTEKKTLLNSDLCVSHCLRCTDFQEAALDPVDIGREVNDEWRQKTWDGNCINPEIKKQKQNISTHRDATKSHFQDRETVSAQPCAGENLSRTLPTITVHCQSCEARARPFHSGESQTLPDRCQHFPTDRQQYSKEHACFRKDTCTQDSRSVPYIAVKISTERQRKDEGSLKQMCSPTWRYKGCDSWMCQRPPSNQTLQCDHPDMGVAGDGKLTILQNTERLPDHLRRSVESGKDSAYQIEKSAHQDPSSTTQDELEDHKTNSLSSYPMCSSQSYRREPFLPSGETVSPAVRLVNGQEYRREERNLRLAKPSERDHQIVPHSPNERSPVIESPSDECTPVIVQCYSLSTVSSTLPPSSMSDSQFMNRREPASSVHSISGDPTFLARPSHSRYLHQQHSPRSLKSASPMQSNEPFLYDSPGPRSVPNPRSYNFAPQAKHTIDESSTIELGVDDEEKQTRSATLPEQFQKRCAIPANCPCRNCQRAFHAFKNGYDGNYSQTHRRDHRPFNAQWTETHRNTSRNGSQQSIVHAPNDHHISRSSVDLRNGHESGDMFPNWQTRKVPGESRPALNIHDYYEERRIVVGKVYQNVPRSVESSQLNQSSTIPFARTGQLYRQKPYRSSVTNAEVFQTHAGEQSTIKICNQQPDIAVGSKKRKSRQPRPQRVKSSDPALAREEHQHPIQHEEDRHDDFTHSNYHNQASSPFRHHASVSEETSRKRREEVNKTEVHAYGHDHESTNPVQHESATRRDDHVFNSNSTGPDVRRREFPPECPSPLRTFVHEKITNKVSPERSEQFSEFQRSPRVVPPYQLVGKDKHANHNSREYPVNSYYQVENPNKYFAYSNDNAIPERNAEPQYSLSPTRMRGPENHFETSERIRSGCDSAGASFSSRKLGSRIGPSQRSTLIPTEERVRVASQFESTSESTWDVPATPIHGVHQGDRFYHHVGSTNGKSPQSDSETQLSLPSDNGCVSSTTVDDGVELHGNDRPFQSIQATATTNRRSRPLKEQVKSGLFLHTREVWANYMAPAIKERKFVCRYCSKKFAHFSTLQNHIRTHTGDKPFQCKFCSRRFAQSGVLKAHLRTHTGDKPFACMYCGKMFAQSTTLTNHLRTHTGHKPYVCQFCSKSFSQPSTLRKHELSHTKERPYPCKFCGKAFAQQSTLTNHLRSHTGQRPYKCHFCEKSFAQLSTLDRHLRLHSSASVKPYQCRHCSKSFSYFSNLASHMQNHEQEQK